MLCFGFEDAGINRGCDDAEEDIREEEEECDSQVAITD